MPTDHPLPLTYELGKPHKTSSCRGKGDEFYALCHRTRTCSWFGQIFDNVAEAESEGKEHLRLCRTSDDAEVTRVTPPGGRGA